MYYKQKMKFKNFKVKNRLNDSISDTLFLDQSHLILGVRCQRCLVTNVDRFYLFDHYTQPLRVLMKAPCMESSSSATLHRTTYCFFQSSLKKQILGRLWLPKDLEQIHGRQGPDHIICCYQKLYTSEIMGYMLPQQQQYR